MTEYCVSLYEIDEDELIEWAINNCDSFIYKTIKDARIDDQFVSLHKFYFTSEKDAMWFRLHWE